MAVEVKLFDDLDAVGEDAGGSLDREARGSLFERLDWFRLVERHCSPPGKLLVIRASEGDGRAWLFLKVDGHKAVALANWYSLRFGPIISCRGDRDAGYRLTEALIASLRRCRIAAIDLQPLIGGDPLSLCMPGKLWLHRVSPASVSWSMNTSDLDFATYWTKRPSRLRNTAERKAKAAALDIRIHSAFSEEAWSDYERVYRASWKPDEGSPAFLRALAEMEGAAGTLRLGIASKDGRAVAAQLWLTEGRSATIHKLAYAEDAKAMSPGTILSMEMFRHALDVDRVNGIDFGLGDDAYKADWIDHSRPMYRLAAYDLLSPRGLWQAGRLAAAKLVRRARSD